MSEFNKYSTDGGATFIDVEDSNAVHWADNAILGAKNLLKNISYSHTINGVVWTVNADGSITANGKATGGNSALYICGTDGTFINNLPSRDLIFSGCPSGGSVNSYWMDFRYRVGSSTTNQFLNDTGSGATISWDDTKKYDIVRCFIKDGYTADNITFYPMIRLASDTDTTYVPYAMTNRELTEIKTEAVTALKGTVHSNTICKKSGNVVALGLYMTGVTAEASAWKQLATIPNECTPSTMYQGFYYSPAGFGQIQINTNGKIQIYPHTALNNSNLFANITWIM